MDGTDYIVRRQDLVRSDAAQSVKRTLAESGRRTADAPPTAICGDLPIDQGYYARSIFCLYVAGWPRNKDSQLSSE